MTSIFDKIRELGLKIKTSKQKLQILTHDNSGVAGETVKPWSHAHGYDDNEFV